MSEVNFITCRQCGRVGYYNTELLTDTSGFICWNCFATQSVAIQRPVNEFGTMVHVGSFPTEFEATIGQKFSTADRQIYWDLKKKVDSFNAPQSASERRENRKKWSQRRCERYMAREAGVSSFVGVFIWWGVSYALRAIITEMAKRLYDKLNPKEGGADG